MGRIEPLTVTDAANMRIDTMIITSIIVSAALTMEAAINGAQQIAESVRCSPGIATVVVYRKKLAASGAFFNWKGKLTAAKAAIRASGIAMLCKHAASKALLIVDGYVAQLIECESIGNFLVFHSFVAPGELGKSTARALLTSVVTYITIRTE